MVFKAALQYAKYADNAHYKQSQYIATMCASKLHVYDDTEYSPTVSRFGQLVVMSKPSIIALSAFKMRAHCNQDTEASLKTVHI